MIRTYRVEWRMRGDREWTELGTPRGRVDTFRTKRAAEAKCRWLKERNNFVITRVIAPPDKEKRHA